MLQTIQNAAPPTPIRDHLEEQMYAYATAMGRNPKELRLHPYIIAGLKLELEIPKHVFLREYWGIRIISDETYSRIIFEYLY